MTIDLTLFGLFLAFGGGLVSFLSPCVLPLVPGYVAWVAGTDLATARAERWRALRLSAFFVPGFGLVFVLLGLGATSIGGEVRRWSYELTIIAVLRMEAMGLVQRRVRCAESYPPGGDKPGWLFSHPPRLGMICHRGKAGLRRMSCIGFIARLVLTAWLVVGATAQPWSGISALANPILAVPTEHASDRAHEHATTSPEHIADHAADKGHAHRHASPDHVHEAMTPSRGYLPQRAIGRALASGFISDGLPPGPSSRLDRPPRRMT